MSQNSFLTPETEALISACVDKWQKIAFSTEPINRDQATEAVKQAYALINQPEPVILFYDRPALAENVLLDSGLKSLGFSINYKIEAALTYALEETLNDKIDYIIDNSYDLTVMSCPWEIMGNYTSLSQGGSKDNTLYFNYHDSRLSLTEDLIISGLNFDLCFTVLNCKCDRDLLLIINII